MDNYKQTITAAYTDTKNESTNQTKYQCCDKSGSCPNKTPTETFDSRNLGSRNQINKDDTSARQQGEHVRRDRSSKKQSTCELIQYIFTSHIRVLECSEFAPFWSAPFILWSNDIEYTLIFCSHFH